MYTRTKWTFWQSQVIVRATLISHDAVARKLFGSKNLQNSSAYDYSSS
jgi:hypothetical protein